MIAAVNELVIPMTFRCMMTHVGAETLRGAPSKVGRGGGVYELKNMNNQQMLRTLSTNQMLMLSKGGHNGEAYRYRLGRVNPVVANNHCGCTGRV